MIDVTLSTVGAAWVDTIPEVSQQTPGMCSYVAYRRVWFQVERRVHFHVP